MSSFEDITWNPTPHNGQTVFFTKDVFESLLGSETHETRLEERLKNVGIHLATLDHKHSNKPFTYLKEEHSTLDFDSHKAASDFGSEKQSEKVGSSSCEENNISEETFTVLKTEQQGEFISPENETDENVEDDTSSNWRPKSFYSEVCEKANTVTDLEASTSHSQEKQPMARNISGAQGNLDEHQPVFDNNIAPVESHSQNNKQKPSMAELDKNFYNIRDRLEKDRYMALIFCKKPNHRKSQFSVSQQRLYLDLFRQYGHLLNTDIEDGNNAEFNRFKKLAAEVKREQGSFQQYLKTTSKKCKKDYEYVHPEVKKYVSAKFLAKRRRVLTYPRHFKFVKKIALDDDVGDGPQPTLQHVRPLLQLGVAKKLLLPNILPGLPQPCTPTNFKKINEIDPAIRDNYTGPYVWSNEACSQDVNAEQLAVPNLCNVVMSASVVKYLIDNQGNNGRHWEMPVTVREYLIGEGEKSFIHRVAFIDKPIIKPTEFTPKDQNQLYQKHAIRAVAFRQRQKGYSFIRAKPVHSVVKAPAAEDIENELQSYENFIKEKMKNEPVCDLNKPESNESKGKKNRRKKGKGKQDKGMFATVQEIDDLETFGMDCVPETKVKLENKSPKAKGIKQAIQAEETTVAEGSLTETLSFVQRKKLRQSADNDLELLKLELQGIKSKAQSDAEKSHLASQHMFSPTKANTDSENVAETVGTSKADVKDVSKRSSAGWSNILMTEIEKPSITETVYTADKQAKSKLTKMCSAKAEDVAKGSTPTVNRTKEASVTKNKCSVASQIDLHESQERQTVLERKIGRNEDAQADNKGNKPEDNLSKIENENPECKDVIDSKEKKEVEVVIDKKQHKDELEKCKEISADESGCDSDNDELVIYLPEDVSPVKDRRTRSRSSLTTAEKGQGHKEPEAVDVTVSKLCFESISTSNKMDTETSGSGTEKAGNKDIISNKKPGNQVTNVSIGTESEMEEVQSDVEKLKKSDDTINVADDKIIKNVQITNEGKANVTTRASKRQSTTSVLEDSPRSKRLLRSSVGKVESKETDLEVTVSPGRKRRASAKDEKMDTSADEVKQEPTDKPFATPVTTRGRGRQKAGTPRGSRSRSASCDNEPSSEDAVAIRRNSKTSREIDPSTPVLPEQTVNNPVQVKRKRGRPKKSAQTCVLEAVNQTKVINNNADKNEAKTDDRGKTVVETVNNIETNNARKVSVRESRKSKIASNEGGKISDDQDSDLNIAKGTDNSRRGKRGKAAVNYKSSSDDEEGALVIDIDEDDANAQNKKDVEKTELKKPLRKRSRTGEMIEVDEDDSHDSLEKELNSPKRKGIPKIADSDEDDKDNENVKSPTSGKSVQEKQLNRKTALSKSAKDEEAEKIKAMADAMKKKIEERKLELGSKQAKTVSKVPLESANTTTAVNIATSVKIKDNTNGSRKSAEKTNSEQTICSNVSSIVSDTAKVQNNHSTIQSPPRESTSANQPPKKESISCEQVQFGVDSILQSSSEFRPRADALKGSIIETLAANHGISHIALPIDENVTYHHWTLGDTNALIRVKYHGFMQGQGLVHIAPKMEYQPIFGYERETLNEVARNWASIYVRPNSSLVRCRVNAFNSEIMKIEAVQFQDLIPPESLFCPKQAFADLDLILQQIKSLGVGQYLMRNNPKNDTISIMKAVTDQDCMSYDLHLAHTTLMMSKVNKPPAVQWLPIDTRHLLPHHRKLNLIPCTFPPPDMGPVEKKKFHGKKRKKSKNKSKP